MAAAETNSGPARFGDTALLTRLLTRGWEFDFFQAVWLLERYGGARVPVGDRGPVAEEPFRFRPDISLGFSPTDVRRISQTTDAGGQTTFYQIDVTFMGLYGVCTPLPLHYAVDLLRSVEQHSAVLPEVVDGEPGDGVARVQSGAREAASHPTRAFLDIFHHRLISLFYRSWLKYRYGRAFGTENRDVITAYLLWLIGCPGAYDEEVLGVPPIRLLRYGGVLTQHPRSATSLEGVLLDYWGDVSVEVEQCVGRWVSVPPADRNEIGVTNSTLGTDLTVGEQVYDLGGAFNVTIGPTDWATYLYFLPREPRFEQTRALVQLYCADPLSFTMELCLRAREAPELQLCSDDGAARLGYTSWVRTGELDQTSVTFAVPSRAAGRAPPRRGQQEEAVGAGAGRGGG